MNFIEKMIVGFIERSCKNYVTTIIGLLGLLLFAFNTFGTLIPAQFHDLANMAAVIIQAVALTLAKDSNKPTDNIPAPTKLVAVLLMVGLAVAFSPVAAHAQTLPANVYAVGVSGAPSASPAVAGTFMYAHSVTSSAGTYAFTVADILPNTSEPFTVTTNIGAGVAQKVATIASIPVYIPTSAGISLNGSNTGWAWSTGGMAVITFKNNWYIMPNIRVVKSSVANGTGYQPIIGLMFGWGQ